jgi:hypothetical protein
VARACLIRLRTVMIVSAGPERASVAFSLRAPTPGCRTRPPVIVKDFITAKTFRAYSTNFLRQEKSFRDHGGELG